MDDFGVDEVEGGRVKYPEIDTSPIIDSSIGGELYGEFGERVKYPEIDAMEEPKRGLTMVEYNKIYVAVGKEVKESKSTLIWALQNSKGKMICIVHVHVPAQMIPMPMGGKFPASKVGAKELQAFRENEKAEMLRTIDYYMDFCAQVGARAENIHIEANSIEEGIVELVSKHGIGRLVMGAAADNRYSRRRMEKPKSKKANYVRQHAPDFCHIWFVCRGRLIYTREGVKQPNPDVESRPSTASESNESTPSALSQELNSKLTLFGFGGYEGSSGELDQQSRVSYSQSSIQSPETQSVFSSPRSSFAITRDGGESRLDLMALPRTPNRYRDSSPPSVLQESGLNNDIYDRLEQAMLEAESSKREAFDESMRRRKAEKETMEAIRKAQLAERLYSEELRQRKEIEEEMAKGKHELENAKTMNNKVSKELDEALDQKKSLESQIEKLDDSVKEMEEKIMSAVELLQKYKEERDAIEIERDRALQEVEFLRKQKWLGEGSSDSYTPEFFSKFSFADIEETTNGFDPDLKIGEGGYGTIYRGFLRHAEVAIKILHPDSMQGPREFQQEVDVLSKLRHPNLVTLIGACPESWALIYEYLHGGSLEDRLNCKDNTPPLPWQTRIRIAAELCSVLVFLHSNHPNSIIHGDLKPSNILLDANLVLKLSDFGICGLTTSDGSDLTARFFTTEPRGTFSYMDPEFLATGELTTRSDVYSFGVILLRLLTGKPALGIAKEVQWALDNDNLDAILDPSAGDWPFVQAKQLAEVALRCCDMNGRNRPELGSEVWRVLEPMRASCRGLGSIRRVGDDHAPFYFLCPIFQEIMQDPHIAADGFTYEAEAIKGWLDGGHDTSPMTNMRLENHTLVPNRALRSAIQEWLQHNCIV